MSRTQTLVPLSDAERLVVYRAIRTNAARQWGGVTMTVIFLLFVAISSHRLIPPLLPVGRHVLMAGCLVLILISILLSRPPKSVPPPPRFGRLPRWLAVTLDHPATSSVLWSIGYAMLIVVFADDHSSAPPLGPGAEDFIVVGFGGLLLVLIIRSWVTGRARVKLLQQDLDAGTCEDLVLAVDEITAPAFAGGYRVSADGERFTLPNGTNPSDALLHGGMTCHAQVRRAPHSRELLSIELIPGSAA